MSSMQSRMETSQRTIREKWKWNKAEPDKYKVIVKALIIILPAKRWDSISKK